MENLSVTDLMRSDFDASYEKFKDKFYLLYKVDVHPSLLKLCFYNGYEAGMDNTIKMVKNEFINETKELL